MSQAPLESGYRLATRAHRAPSFVAPSAATPERHRRGDEGGHGNDQGQAEPVDDAHQGRLWLVGGLLVSGHRGIVLKRHRERAGLSAEQQGGEAGDEGQGQRKPRIKESRHEREATTLK